MSGKGQRRKVHKANLKITIESDIVPLPLMPKGLYKIRVFYNNNEIKKPVTGLNTFENAMLKAIEIKMFMEIMLHRNFSMECILVLESVLPLIDKDATLRAFIDDGDIAPIREQLQVKLLAE